MFAQVQYYYDGDLISSSLLCGFTRISCCLQAAGIRYIGFRNEQAAGYAAAACGYLTGVPGVLLTVSGPGAVHGIAGLSHAGINCWPMIMISGSSEQVPDCGIQVACRHLLDQRP